MTHLGARLVPGLVVVCLLTGAGGGVRPYAPPPLLRLVPDSGLPRDGPTFGGTWADCDGDGQLDLFLSRHGDAPEVWLCRGLRFVAPPGGASLLCPGGLGDEHGAAACDYDGDGDWDVYVTVGADHGRGHGRNRLWRQEAPGVLTDAVDREQLLADLSGRGRGALWIELDGDGVPELLVLNFATPARLFHRRGEAWDDWTPRLAVERPYPGTTLARSLSPWLTTAAAGDVDGDGHPDLVAAGEVLIVLRGDGVGGLADATAASGLGFQHPPLGHVALGDVDGDGDPDLLLVCRAGQLRLWLNESVRGELRFRFGPELTALGATGGLRAALLADFDGDGVLDLYVVRDRAPNAPTGNLLARGRGDGTFAIAPGWGGLPRGTTPPQGACTLDLDRDGDLDLVAFHGDGERAAGPGAVVVFENTAPAGSGLTVDLVPVDGSRHALGARLSLQAGGRTLTRELQCVASPHNGAILPVHFGVAGVPGPYRLTVVWPDGRSQEAWLPAGGCAYHLREAVPAPLALAVDGPQSR